MQNKSLSHSSLPTTRRGIPQPDGKKSATPLGADRYEEIITVSRNRREGSQVGKKILIYKITKIIKNFNCHTII